MSAPLELTDSQVQSLADKSHELSAWGEVLRNKVESEDGASWAVADWLVEGAKAHTEEQAKRKACEVTTLGRHAVNQRYQLGTTFPLGTRVPGASYSHHRAVASLPLKDALRYLEASVAERLSVKDLVARIYRDKRKAIASLPIPEGIFRVVYADPPWECGGILPHEYGPAKNHYPTMSIDEICAMRQRPDFPKTSDNAVLFLWSTVPLLPEALKVLDAWGFEYKSQIVWDKQGNNHWGRYVFVQHELLLIATKGSCTPNGTHVDSTDTERVKLQRSIQTIPHGAHSAKPARFRELIDEMYPGGARIELFARGTLPEGWLGWGDEYEAVEVAA